MRNCLFIFFTLIILPFGPVIPQSFSCSFGTTAACLDYGDKICSSMGKCVSNDAVCFSSFTCGYGGFVCKSTLEDLADDYDKLRNNCNNIVNEYEDLRDRFNSLVSKFNNLNDEYSDLLDRHNNLVGEFNDLNSNYSSAIQNLEEKQDALFEYRSCVGSSNSLTEALSC